MFSAYDLLAPYYDSLSDAEDEELLLECILAWLDKYAPGTSWQALDLGCGTGRLSEALIPSFSSYFAIDQSKAMLDIFRQRFDNPPASLKLCQNNFLNMPWPTTEVIFALTDTLNHLPPEEMPDFFKHAASALKPGGLLIFDLLRLDFLRKERGEQTFYLEFGDLLAPELAMVWENYWDDEEAIADSQFTFFEEVERGLFQRKIASVEEYYYPVESLADQFFPALTLQEELVLDERRLYCFKKGEN